MLLLWSSFVATDSFAYNWCGDASTISCWTLEEGSGTSEDLSSNDNTLTLSGSAAWATANPPAAYSSAYFTFDGSNDWASASDDASFDLTTDITIVAWVYWENGADTSETIVRKNNSQYFLRVQDGVGTRMVNWYDTGTNTRVIADMPFPTEDQWVHIAMTCSGGTCTGYLDGDPQSVSDSTSATLADDFTGDFRVGSRDGTDEFQGDIDEVSIFKSILDSTDIDDIYTNGLVQTASATSSPVTILRNITVN